LQHGEDEEGILGFLLTDIKKEATRHAKTTIFSLKCIKNGHLYMPPVPL
jgi:hypothetical protein